MQGDEKWVHRPESAFGKKTQSAVIVVVALLLIGAALGIYFLWDFINN